MPSLILFLIQNVRKHARAGDTRFCEARVKVLTPFQLLVALPVAVVLRAVRSHSGGCGGVVLFLPVFCIMFLKNSQNGLRHLDIYMTEDLKRAAVCVCA